MKEFKWGDFKDWDEVEDFGGFATDRFLNLTMYQLEAHLQQNMKTTI